MFNRIQKVATPIAILFLLSSYSFLPAVAGVLSPVANADETEPKEEVFYYLTDHLGGIDVVTDENGNVVERKDYLPFGEERLGEQLVEQSGEQSGEQLAPQPDSQSENYGYIGKEQDDETGLYYYGARYYDSEIGRFTQIDPLVLGESEKPLADVLSNPQALNGYSYVLNNPMRYVDEEGQYEIDVHFDSTLYLGKQAGLTDGQALEIAYQDQYTDINTETSPWNEDNGWKHFANTDVAEGWVKNSIKEKNIDSFGQSLHYYQDSYSHYMNGYSWTKGGHILDSALSYLGLAKNPDKTYNNVPRADEMTKGTFYLMREFKKVTYGTGDLKVEEFDKQSDELWSNISSTVTGFNSAKEWQKDVYFSQSGYEKMERSFIEPEK